MKSQYCLYQEDRVFFGHVERGLLAVLKRCTNQTSESKAVAAMLTGLWNLPFITPGLFCAIEYSPNEAAMRFEISEEVLSFAYGSGFHASFWPGDECRHIGSRFGESSDPMSNYHSWKALLEMFENDLSNEETPFTLELISYPSLASSPSWNKLPSWESRGFPGIKDIQS